MHYEVVYVPATDVASQAWGSFFRTQKCELDQRQQKGWRLVAVAPIVATLRDGLVGTCGFLLYFARRASHKSHAGSLSPLGAAGLAPAIVPVACGLTHSH